MASASTTPIKEAGGWYSSPSAAAAPPTPSPMTPSAAVPTPTPAPEVPAAADKSEEKKKASVDLSTSVSRWATQVATEVAPAAAPAAANTKVEDASKVESGSKVETVGGGWVVTPTPTSPSAASPPAATSTPQDAATVSPAADAKPTEAAPGEQQPPTAPAQTVTPRKPMPDRNRVATGGTAKDKLTPDQLEAKMAAMRIQNEALRLKRAAAVADESSFAQIAAKDKEEADLLRAEERRKVDEERREREERKKKNNDLQAQINAEREATAARKLAKVQGRDWDREKLEGGADGAKERQYPSQNWVPRTD
ncbi:hypothetical protein RQP46_009713 [Phenoliferia psychrophenolica]